MTNAWCKTCPWYKWRPKWAPREVQQLSLFKRCVIHCLLYFLLRHFGDLWRITIHPMVHVKNSLPVAHSRSLPVRTTLELCSLKRRTSSPSVLIARGIFCLSMWQFCHKIQSWYLMWMWSDGINRTTGTSEEPPQPMLKRPPVPHWTKREGKSWRVTNRFGSHLRA